MSSRRHPLPLLVVAFASLVVPALGAAATTNPPSGIEQYIEEIPTATGTATTPGRPTAPSATTPAAATPAATGGASTTSETGQQETQPSPQPTATVSSTPNTPLATPGAVSDADDSHALLWVALGLVTAALVLVSAAFSRRRRGPSQTGTP